MAPSTHSGSEDDQQRREVDRLGEKLLGAFLDRRDGQLDAGVRGEDDHGDGGVDGLELRQQVEGRAVAQLVVEDDRVRPHAARLGEGVGTVLRLADVEAGRGEEAPDGHPDRLLVVDHQHAVARLRHGVPAFATGCASATGNRIVTTAPPPG